MELLSLSPKRVVVKLRTLLTPPAALPSKNKVCGMPSAPPNIRQLGDDVLQRAATSPLLFNAKVSMSNKFVPGRSPGVPPTAIGLNLEPLHSNAAVVNPSSDPTYAICPESLTLMAPRRGRNSKDVRTAPPSSSF